MLRRKAELIKERARLEATRDVLLTASRTLASSLDYEQTLRNLSSAVVPSFADWCAVDLLRSDGRLHRLEVAHEDPARVRLAMDLERRYPQDPASPVGPYNVLRTGQSEMVAYVTDDMLVASARDAGHLELLREIGFRSYMSVPLRDDGRIVGVLTFVSAESGRHYDAQDLAVAEDLGHRAGHAIAHAQVVADLQASRRQLEEQATELESQAAELEEKASEAADANRAKSDFLAAMSHELRTPLNAIIGYTQILEMGVHGGLTEMQRDNLQRIQRSSHHLLALITDILNYAKIEAGGVKFDMRRLRMADVLQRVEDLIGPQAAEKRVVYAFVNRCGDADVWADEERLLQIFVNLLSNAIRFTDGGGRIEVVCEAGTGHVCATVTDTGAGIPPEKLEAIFEPFVQLDRGYTSTRHGAGLGLAISRDLARAMGGDIRASSDIGRGSAFTVQLPRYRASV